MRVQIRRLSPHQNGKVAAVLMVLVSLPLFALMALVMWFGGPQVSQYGSTPGLPVFMFLVLPFFYLIFVYIAVAFVCAVYNVCAAFIGGFEFDLSEQDDAGPEEMRG